MKTFKVNTGSNRMNLTYFTLAAAKKALRGELGWKRVYSVFIKSEGRYLCYPSPTTLKAAYDDEGAYTPSITVSAFEVITGESGPAEKPTLILSVR